MENCAKNTFYQVQLKKHSNFSFINFGFYVMADLPFLGASPDGIFTCSCHGKGVLEIKCPYNYKNGFINSQSDEKSLKSNHPYFFQMQLHMFVGKVTFGKFFMWSPVEQNNYLQCTVQRGNDFLKVVVDVLAKYFFNVILPEIVSRKRDEDFQHRKQCCFCMKPEFGLMISCNNASCSKKWFHYSCVYVTRKPRGSWFCPQCRS
ncbi:uncharacterized protein LOC136076189 [Hydra vulgaris]|uniref:Uncharacterized protein LOC136076189 n=1 Tax=Hydra vulgaris TaxID=6087 RepID=A0ABM4BA18_HYDVU